MATTLPLQIKCGRLPLNQEGTWQQMFKMMVPRLKGFIPEQDLILGVSGPTQPTYNAGPWYWDAGVDGNQKWRLWSNKTGNYQYETRRVGTSDLHVKLAAPQKARINGLQGSNTVLLQNAAGTVALLADILVPRPTKILEGDTVSMDGSLSDDFFILLTDDTEVTLTGMVDGGVKKLAVENLGTDYTLSIQPSAIKWPAGGAQPAAAVSTDPSALGGYAITIFTFYTIGSTTYGEAEDFSPANATGTVDLGGDPPTNYGGGGSGPPQTGDHAHSLY